MQPIDEYRIIRSNDPIEFEDRVIERLKLGYELYGYPYVQGNMQCQAIVKFKQTEGDPKPS
jgi:hypothetical protein